MNLQEYKKLKAQKNPLSTLDEYKNAKKNKSTKSNGKVTLALEDGKEFGTISSTAYRAITNDLLDYYNPVDDNEKKVLDSFKLQTGAELKKDDGTSLGFVSKAGLKAIEENKTKSYTPINDIEKKTIDSYIEYATKKRRAKIDSYKETAKKELTNIKKEKEKISADSSKLRHEKAVASRSGKQGTKWGLVDTRTAKEKREGKPITQSKGDKELKSLEREYKKLDEKAEALVETISDIKKYANVVYNDKGFIGQAQANYTQGRLSQDTASAYNDYVVSPTEENRMRADALSALSEQFNVNNTEAFTTEDEKLGVVKKTVRDWVADSFAGYLPQLIDQTVASVKGATIGGATGATVGSIVPGVGTLTGLSYGIKTGWVAGSTQQMFETTRGMVFKSLIDAGYDEETALKAANDEAFVSGIIEGCGEILSMATLGTGKLIGKIAPQAAKKVSSNVLVNGVKNFAAKTGKKISENALLKTTTAVAGVLANAIGEYAEEYSQEAVSIANERRLKNNGSLIGETLSVLGAADEETSARLHEAGKEGFRIGLMSGGATRAAISSPQYITDVRTGRKIKNADIVQPVIDVGLNQPQNSQANKIATKLSSKDKVSSHSLGKLANANKGETVNVGDTYYDTKKGIAYKIVDRNNNTTTIEMVSDNGSRVTKAFPNASADNLTNRSRYVIVDTEAKTENIETPTVAENETADNVITDETTPTSTVTVEKEMPSVSVGDTFIDSNSNDIIKVVARDENGTQIEITTPDGKKETKLQKNTTADRLAADDNFAKVETTKKSINLKRVYDNYEVYGDEAIALAKELDTTTERAVVNGVETEVLRVPADLMLESSKTMEDSFDFVFSDKPVTETTSNTTSENSPVTDKNTSTNETTSPAEETSSGGGITSVANAINDTMLPDTKEGILAGMEESGADGGLSEFAEKLTQIYKENGNLIGLEKFFTDNGESVISAIESMAKTQDESSEELVKEELVKSDETKKLTNKSVEREDGNNEQGRKDLLHDDGKRGNNESTRKHAGGILRDGRQNSGRNATERKNFARELIERGQTEQVTIDNNTFELVKPESYNDDMKAMVEEAEKRGDEIGFFVGQGTVTFEKEDGTKRQKTFEGVKTRSGKIYLQYDANKSPQTLYKHEHCHKMWRSLSMQKAKDKILSGLSEIEKKAILSAPRYQSYIEAFTDHYKGDVEKATEETWQEFVCDVMAGMNDYVSKYSDVVSEYWNENEDADGYNAADYSTSTDSGGESKYSSYIYPRLNNREWELLNRRLKSEIGNDENFIDKHTKWLYASKNGTRVFAIYGIGWGDDPTPLLAVGGNKADLYRRGIERYLEGRKNGSDRSRTSIDRRIKSLLVNRGESSDNLSADGDKGTKAKNGTVYSGQRESNGKGIDGSSTKNSKRVAPSPKDSTGKILSKRQVAYFKDSKVRDEGGNLKVMYRGDKENFTVFDKKKTKHSNLYGRGFYFTDSKSHAEQYGDAKEYYLNITNPLSPKQNAITKEQMLNFLKAIENNGEDYDLYNYGEGATAESVLNSVWGKGDFEMLQDVSASAIGDLVAAVELFNEVNGTSYDGIVLLTETVTFESEQAKYTSNLNPTKSRDVRWSFSEKNDSDYDKVFELQHEIAKISREIGEIEDSAEYSKAMDDFFESKDADAYSKYLKDSGYNKLKKRMGEAQKELQNLQKELAAKRETEAVNEERKAIEKSGLSEADYFRKKAVKEFGYTPYFYDAGYITPNGKMLNFSGEKGMHYGSRGQDHRAIGIVYANVQGGYAMVKFMGEGNVRIMAESPGIDVSSMTEPTKEQYATIRKFVREYADKNYFNVDITDAEGRTVGNYEYEGRVSAERVANDIKYFFENGTTREQSSVSAFRYSFAEEQDNEYAPTFYSLMGKTIDEMKQDKIGANSVVSYLKGRGVKDEEIKWSGIETFLDGKKSVTKAELQEFVAGSQLQIEESIATELSTIDYTDQERDALLAINQRLAASWTEAEELWEDRFDEEMPLDIRFNDNATSLVRRELRKRAGDNFDGLCEGIRKCIEDIERQESRQDFIVSRAKERQKDSGLETRWEQYKLAGGENYREITFKMPNSDYTNAAMRTHWGDNAKGILAHARIQDFDVDGKKMLFVEEIQSDWHNAGNKNGYLSDDFKAISVDDTKIIQKSQRYYLYSNNDEVLDEIHDNAVEFSVGLNATKEEIQEFLVNEYNRTKGKVSGKAPDAPFRNNYHEYVLKHLIRMAAEEGYDSIGWTTADIQSERWSDEYAEGYRIEYDQDIPKFLNKYGKKWGAKVGHITLNGGERINLDKNKATFRWDMDADAFGNEGMVEYILQYDGEDTDVVYDDDQLRDLGVDTDYGDEILNYLWKEYSKGISGDVVWSMPITDSMKESVLYEGQPRYSFAEEDNLKTQKRIEGIAEEINSHEEFIEVAKRNTKEFVDKIKENKSLQKRLDNAKRQMLLSPKPAVSAVKVGNITKQILVEMESTLKANDLKDEIMSVYNEYFAEIKKAKGVKSKVETANDNMLDRFAKLAVDIVDSSVAYAESEEYELLKSYVKNTRISIPEDAKGEAHYAEFRKSHMGTFNLTNDGLPIDRAYQELCDMFPGLFSTEVTSPADQLNAIAKALETTKPYAYNPHQSYMKDAIDHVVYRFASEVDGLAVMPKTKAQKIAEKGAYDKNMALEKEKTNFEQKLNKHKEQSERTIRKLQKKIDDADYVKYWEKRLSKEEKIQAVNKVREKRDIAILKTKIRNIVSDMKKNLDKTEKNGGYPKELVKAAADVCSAIDFHTDKTNKDGTPTKTTLKLDSLKAEYEALKNNPNYDFASEYSEELNDKIENLRQTVNKKRIVDLSKSELENLKDILSEISTRLSEARKQIGQAEARANVEIATEIINSLKADKKAISEIRNHFLQWMNLTKERGKAFVVNPHRVFEMIANYDRNSAWWKLYEQILRGSRKVAKFVMDATMPFDELTEGGGNEIAFYDFRTKMHKTGIKYQDGTDVVLPKSIICEIVMLWDRKQGRNHLETGGVKIPDLKFFNEGKTEYALSVGKMTNAITQSDIDRLKGMLDSYDKAWIERSRHLFNKVAKDAINEVSMQLVGRELAKADNYIRIYVDSDFVRKDIGKNETDITIEGHGSLKETTPDAKHPLIVRGLHENVYEHIDFASKYYGLAIPIRNFNKVYGISINDNGNPDSVKNTLGSIFGPKIRDGVVVQTIKDLQSPRHRELSFFNKVRGKWLGATFWGNARSMFKQTTSYWTASSILGEDSLAKGMVSYNTHRKQTKAEIAKYSGTLYKRSQGLSTTELGDRANRKRLAGLSSKTTKLINNKLPVLRKIPEWIRPENWLQSMDCAVSSTLWDACKFEVEKTMKKTDEGYMQAVADLYERVIEETQSNYDVLHRPEALKSTNEITASLAMFQTDNLQQTGIMYGAFSDLQAKHKAYKADKSSINEQNLKDAQKRMAKAIRSRIYSSMWLAAVTMLGNVLLRKFKSYIDDEEKEITAKSSAKQVLLNMSEDMLGVFVPIVGSFVGNGISTFKYGYDLATVPAIDVLEDFIKATSKIYKAYEKDEEVLKAWVDSIPAISNMTGVPAKNIMDLFNGIKGYIGDIKAGEFAHDVTDYTTGNKPFYGYGDLATYIVSGDEEKETKFLEYYSESGKKIAKGSLTQEIRPAYVQMYIDSPAEVNRIKRKLILDYDYTEDTINKWLIAEYLDTVSEEPEYASEIATAIKRDSNWLKNISAYVKSYYKTLYKDGEDTSYLDAALMRDYRFAEINMQKWKIEADKERRKQEAEKEKYR